MNAQLAIYGLQPHCPACGFVVKFPPRAPADPTIPRPAQTALYTVRCPNPTCGVIVLAQFFMELPT